MTDQALRDIDDCVKIIQDRCAATASLETKRNAMETLRRIRKSICLGDGIIGREIKQCLSPGGELL